MGTMINLGPIQIEWVSGLTTPAAPNDEPTFNWPTSAMAAGTSVTMVTGQTWRVQRPPVVMQDGRVQVVLRDPVRKATATFNVGADDLDVAAWNVGSVLPPPVILDPPVDIEPVPPVPGGDAPPADVVG